MKKIFLALLLLPATAQAGPEESLVAIIEKAVALVESEKGDCAKMGTDLTKFAADNAAEMDRIRAAREKETPDERKEAREKLRDRRHAARERLKDGTAKCAEDLKVKAALEKLRPNMHGQDK
jgi:hypothetical protein